jgi:hypothetical protein
MKLIRTLTIVALAVAGLTVATPAQARIYGHYYGHRYWGPHGVAVIGGGPYYYGNSYSYGPGYGVTFGLGGHPYYHRGYGRVFFRSHRW